MEYKNENYIDPEDKKERFQEAKIWIVFMIIAGLIFSKCVIEHVGETWLKYTGEKVTTKFIPNAESVIVQKEDGSYFGVNIGGFVASHRDTEIDLFYKEDITKAKPVTAPWFWFTCEVFFGGITVLCCYLARKNIKVTSHLKRLEKSNK